MACRHKTLRFIHRWYFILSSQSSPFSATGLCVQHSPPTNASGFWPITTSFLWQCLIFWSGASIFHSGCISRKSKWKHLISKRPERHRQLSWVKISMASLPWLPLTIWCPTETCARNRDRFIGFIFLEKRDFFYFKSSLPLPQKLSSELRNKSWWNHRDD